MNPIRNRLDDSHSNIHSNAAHSNAAVANGNGRVAEDGPLRLAIEPVRLAARKAADAIADTIVARPATSLAAAAAIGFLLGQIWKRK